ncbi:hypothetical protein KP22_10195 [Pectobacterium betavasculorum]|uniref:Uncharacterized protein n=1 Tax=Pectobacterium betavasculorum TaxID=55207 RepID=A0A093RSS0_9GAMM|nr:hypothetical protein [Pectobacterium betavasculorum]KFX06207.1 hypothetical protein KP22_10195 [Pectobacterium betavasculorum]
MSQAINPRPLYEILIELEKVGHSALWLTSPHGKDCLERYPFDQSQWYLPNIITGDGRTVAHREERPNGWLLCGDWKTTQCRPSAALPTDAIPLDERLKFHLIARGK